MCRGCSCCVNAAVKPLGSFSGASSQADQWQPSLKWSMKMHPIKSEMRDAESYINRRVREQPLFLSPAQLNVVWNSMVSPARKTAPLF